MVPTYHYDRQSAAQPRQRGGNMEPTAGDDPGVGEPEVEEIAVDEQAIAQFGDRIEELEQCFLGSRRRNAQMGVGHDHEGAAKHGAKDGVPPRPVQPEMKLTCQARPPERLTVRLFP